MIADRTGLAAGQAIGLYLGDSFVRAVSDGAEATLQTMSRIPPAAILSDARSRPISADLDGSWIHGNGLPWPPIARIDRDYGAARIPASIAWHGLAGGYPHWMAGGSVDHRVRSPFAAALAVMVAAGTDGSGGPASVVVPDRLAAEQQDELLRAIRRHHRSARLLWRPIAAALSWIEQHPDPRARGSERPDTAGDNGLGYVLAIHLGLDGVEAAAIELIDGRAYGVDRVLPARRLPRRGAASDFVLALSEQAASRLVHGRTPATELAAAWHLLWSTPLLSGAGCSGSHGDLQLGLHGTDVDRRFREALDRLGTTVADMGGPHRPAATPSSLAPTGSDLSSVRRAFLGEADDLGSAPPRTWIDQLARLESRPVVGAVVTGGLAPGSAVGSLVGDILDELGCPPAGRLVAEDPGSLLARGAALHAARVAAGEPGYLDTLPKIETLVSPQGEPVWLDLTGQSSKDDRGRFVPGGKTWTHVPEQLGLGVKRDETELKLDLWREGTEHVRKTVTTFSEPVAEDSPVDLQISMDPGQGLPHLLVRPANERAFGGRRVELDWLRADDTRKSREEIAADEPRTNPPLEPRRASRSLWQGMWVGFRDKTFLCVANAVDCFLANPASTRYGITKQLSELRSELWSREPDVTESGVPVHATSVSSDGELHPDASREDLLIALQVRLDELLASDPPDDLRDELYRCMGYISSPTQAVEDQIASILGGRAHLSGAELVLIGNCLRREDLVHQFLERFIEQVADGKRVNDCLRALARILQYRDTALADVPSPLAGRALELCEQVLDREIKRRAAKFLYRHASLCVVYMLRRRRHDPDFLDPQSDLARALKSQFDQAIHLFNRHQLSVVGGFVDLPHVTQTLIDYIDRKGRGRLTSLMEH